ncbi:MAG TPA: cobalamin-dependent protein, partial [Ktedonobacteraceae bacterium]|nr:cobalamin-dependent protein [Ktedonobacteraceae bacterium]
MVWPRVPSSFWGLQHTSQLLPERAPIPPLGLITVAALCPKEWKIRLIDQNFEAVTDDDIRDADLVMVSAMRVQIESLREVLIQTRALGKRSMVGGPYASSEPEALLSLADHIVVGEPDAEFQSIASDVETGWARRLYVIHNKPDVTCTPVPRFDLLNMNMYGCMAVQFSRG